MDGKACQWEQRWHPLRREWVVYSAHRNQRPWDGVVESPGAAAPPYDPDCYLCPGNARVHGHANPDYQGVFVFDNDHPVVGRDAPRVDPGDPLYQRRPATGMARVICYDPRHHVCIADLDVAQVAAVLDAWREQTAQLAREPDIRFVLLFENRGDIVGTSSPHPHCQLYATNFPYKNIEREQEAAAARPGLFAEILRHEEADRCRVLAANDHAIAFIPFFARYSYEAWLFPRRRVATFAELTDAELTGIAEVYQCLVRRYDLLYRMPFPYVMSVYQAPFDTPGYDDYHLHLVFLPPLRQPGLRKFPAGPEIGGGNFMCDTIPEQTAADLLAVDPATYMPTP